MPEFDIAEIMLLKYRIPSITAYNRLEPTPRTARFDRSLKAEIRDPMWLLCRQWQFGEFQGEDAASPLTAQILGMHTAMDRIVFPHIAFPYDENIPLETKVEAEKLTASLFLAVQMGRSFLKLMKKDGLAAALPRFIGKYKLVYDPHPNDTEGWQLLNAVTGTIFDGFLLYNDITTVVAGKSRFQQWMDDELLSASDQDKFNIIAEDFTSQHARNYTQPADATHSAWLPSELEYQFAVSAMEEQGQQKTLTVDRYHEGHLDWYSFDIDAKKRAIPEEVITPKPAVENYVSFLPAPVSFKGMPHPRFWMMEEGQTDFGKIDTSPTGLLHLLLAEFGLIYSNDWFLLPYPLSVNNLCEIKGIVITDVFGHHTLVRPAGRGKETNWHRWVMFHQTDINDSNTNSNYLYLPAAVSGSLEGQPLEQVNFLRDEMANLVWGVENTVPSQAGKGVSGNEMAIREKGTLPFVPAGNAVIRYVLGTTVPENWIPFIPVHMEGSDTEIKLQRARMPGSKGALGIVLTEQQAPYYINEQQVPRSGVIVERSFQRTRWWNGKTYLWLGRYKAAGMGEGWSNLKFDQIEDIGSDEG